jgi:MFS superfamily sulfate permease-like transporter
MAIPQGVSFASMAGLPAQFGLYTAFVPVLTYCFFGGSRYLVWESSFAVELI